MTNKLTSVLDELPPLNKEVTVQRTLGAQRWVRKAKLTREHEFSAALWKLTECVSTESTFTAVGLGDRWSY